MRAAPSSLPIVGVSACLKTIGPHPFHAAGDKYVRAVSHGAKAVPFLLPALGAWYEPAALLGHLDGLLLTGSPSNVEPRHYDGPASVSGTEHDPARDEAMLPLVTGAIEAGVPLLAICRGIQELNVALGGTLHQRLQDVPGRLDHRGRRGVSLDRRYGAAHGVVFAEGGFFHRLAGARERTVNSLHEQAIDRPADRLALEATAADGTIEAVRVKDAPAFAIGVQWHPEWKFWDDALSTGLLAAFGDACRARAAARLAPRRAAE